MLTAKETEVMHKVVISALSIIGGIVLAYISSVLISPHWSLGEFASAQILGDRWAYKVITNDGCIQQKLEEFKSSFLLREGPKTFIDEPASGTVSGDSGNCAEQVLNEAGQQGWEGWALLDEKNSEEKSTLYFFLKKKLE